MTFIQNEHPQTVALVLANLSAESAAIILSALPPEVQLEVARRIAVMERANPDVIMELERVLERKISAVFTQELFIIPIIIMGGGVSLPLLLIW